MQGITEVLVPNNIDSCTVYCKRKHNIAHVKQNQTKYW